MIEMGEDLEKRRAEAVKAEKEFHKIITDEQWYFKQGCEAIGGIFRSEKELPTDALKSLSVCEVLDKRLRIELWEWKTAEPEFKIETSEGYFKIRGQTLYDYRRY